MRPVSLSFKYLGF